MLLIQQSSVFRIWTSRALMIYFRRALLFLVVSPRQYRNNNNNYYLSQQQKVYFSDAEDDEEILMIDNQKKFNRNENNSKNELKHYLSKKYVSEKLCQGLNNSMKKSIDDSFLIETRNNIHINESKVSDDFLNHYQTIPLYSSKQQTTPINFHNETDTLAPYNSCVTYTSSILSNSVNMKKKDLLHFNLQSCLPLTSSFDNDISSPFIIQQNLSESSDDEDDIYEKYQTSFSHILHQTKSIHNEDKLRSMLVFEPNTTNITVRLIANQTDLSFPYDIKPIGCKKLQATSIL